MDDNIERYDRQIRLWGHHGQNKCSDARVCLVNSNSLGAEILKGLCLAGIASFTILDSHKLTPEDVGCIFISRNSVGMNRGQSVRQMLLQLNGDVSGEVHPVEKYLPQNISTDNESNYEMNPVDVEFWKRFDVVIISGFLNLNQIMRLSKICWSLNTPLLVCKSIGFFGSMRIQVQEHLIVETHPDNPLPDFSLDKPFSDLRCYLDSIDLESDDSIDEINKYPYVVIVYYYLKRWQNHNGFQSTRLPSSYQEKSALRELISEGLKRINKMRKQRKRDEDSGLEQEIMFDNFHEADKAVNSCFSISSKLPSSVQNLFDHPKIINSFETNRSTFWSIMSAIKEFVFRQDDDPTLPISGIIPDMTSSSEQYLRVQNIYAKKAREDIDNVFGIVQNLVGAENGSPGQTLYEETKLICKNIRDLKMINTSAIFQEYDFRSSVIKEDNDEDEYIAIGLSLKALDVFFSAYGRLPGRQPDQVETDIGKLKCCLNQIVGRTSSKLKNLDQCLYELCRYGGAELHATSAFIGGCVAQEAIKFITNQYIPIDDTVIYNAMTASTKTFRFQDAFAEIH